MEIFVVWNRDIGQIVNVLRPVNHIRMISGLRETLIALDYSERKRQLRFFLLFYVYLSILVVLLLQWRHRSDSRRKRRGTRGRSGR